MYRDHLGSVDAQTLYRRRLIYIKYWPRRSQMVFGPESTSGKPSRWFLHLEELSFTVEYLAGKKSHAADAMYRLNISGSDETNKPFDVVVPIFAIEDYINYLTLGDHDIAIPDTEKEHQPKPAKPISIDEMISAQG